ncbi:hypothetical protein ACFO9Q_04505 [Paenibacillus sp. GCM10023252]|uniref:hypothetical protein n=1 Tax=Paenibacillus sp. GCM10023252 TaxID=3252649 RepID=UPI00360B8F33
MRTERHAICLRQLESNSRGSAWSTLHDDNDELKQTYRAGTPFGICAITKSFLRCSQVMKLHELPLAL